MAGSRWDEIFLFSPKGYILSWTQSLDMEKMTAVIPPSNSLSCLPKLHYSTGLPALDQHALLCAWYKETQILQHHIAQQCTKGINSEF